MHRNTRTHSHKIREWCHSASLLYKADHSTLRPEVVGWGLSQWGILMRFHDVCFKTGSLLSLYGKEVKCSLEIRVIWAIHTILNNNNCSNDISLFNQVVFLAYTRTYVNHADNRSEIKNAFLGRSDEWLVPVPSMLTKKHFESRRVCGKWNMSNTDRTRVAVNKIIFTVVAGYSPFWVSVKLNFSRPRRTLWVKGFYLFSALYVNDKEKCICYMHVCGMASIGVYATGNVSKSKEK